MREGGGGGGGLDDNSSFEGLQCEVHELYAPTEENPCTGLLQEPQHPQIPRMMRQTREKTTHSFTYIEEKKEEKKKSKIG